MFALWPLKRKREESDTTFLLEPNEEDQTLQPSLKKRKKAKKLSAGERSANLTSKCNERLAFSQFRAINEYLYSHTSKDAQKYMDNETFDKYHAAYEELAYKWPVKPIDEVIKLLSEHYRNGGCGRVLVDMGCGARPLIKEQFAKATVHSFDLISKHKHIVEADMANVPLKNNSVDCVIFCLSLMGTNIGDCIGEANRILKKGGKLVVAEVASRFEDESVQVFTQKLDKYGFKLKSEKMLQPNNYFVLLMYQLAKDAVEESARPQLTLKPCVYKPR